MKLGSLKIVPVLSALALATVFVTHAHAGCGQYQRASYDPHSQGLFGPAHLLRTAFDGRDELFPGEPTIVGTWKEHWISEGSEGIPDGTEIDAGYSQWHSDGTEINVSGLRSPLTGNVCMGVWARTGLRTYQMNHFGISYDSTGVNLVGPAHIQQWLNLDQKGMATSGRFTIDQYNEQGTVLAHLQGKIIGTRVTMETGFQSVE